MDNIKFVVMSEYQFAVDEMPFYTCCDTYEKALEQVKEDLKEGYDFSDIYLQLKHFSKEDFNINK